MCVPITPTFVGNSGNWVHNMYLCNAPESNAYGSTGLWRGVPPENVKFYRNDRFHANHIRLAQQCTRPSQQTRQLNEWRAPRKRDLREMAVFAQYTCLNLNYSKLWRTSPNIFSGIVHTCALYENIAWNPQHVAAFLGGSPPKKWLSRKSAIFHTPVHKICKGLVAWVPQIL